MKIVFTILVLVFFNGKLTAEDRPENQLSSVHDTKTRSELLLQLIQQEMDRDTIKCLYYISELENLGVHTDSLVLIAKAQQEKGKYLKKRGNFSEAINLFKKSAHTFDRYGDQAGLAGVYNNMGATYVDAGEYHKSIEYLLKALRIYDEMDNKRLKAKCLHNIGLVFYYQKNNALALEYYNKALELRISMKDSAGMALTLNNIGIIHYFNQNSAQALSFFKKALSLYELLGKRESMSMPLFNIAEIYINQKRTDSALYYANQSYSLDTSLSDMASEAKSLILLSKIHLSKKDYDIALKSAGRALKLSFEVGSKEDIKDSYKQLAEIYSENGQHKEACLYFELTLKWQDSLFSKQNADAIAELQTRYETEKKDILLEKQEETIKNQKKTSAILMTGITVTLILLTLVIIEYRQKIKAFIVLKVQKKHITDSINYASRIQSALLPPDDVFKSYLPEHFILYLPKDTVSGDFYWINKIENKIFLAVADCTGHGVPGAFMSMLGFAYLNEIINRNPKIFANDILNNLREKVTSSLHQNSQSINKDGIDMSLVIIDQKSMELHFAGANNPAIICRNQILTYLHPDKMPIGIHFGDQTEPFSIKKIELHKNDLIYLFTDGYVDQYGGEGLKKIGRNNFNSLLLEASTMDMEMQKTFLEERLSDWKKDIEQMDDILVMGIKI